MEEMDKLDDLRPYRDEEIPAAMKRMAADPMLKDMVGFAFPGTSVEDVKEKLYNVHSADEFRVAFVQPMLENIVRRSSTGFTFGGHENIKAGQGHVFMSDHRDIVLDGALFQLVLIYAGFQTSEITFGSNLICAPFVEDFGRSNKMYKIMRGGTGRELVRNSHILSEHIHEVVADGRSIWISQRDGRTKNGDDHTDQGLIKMLTLACDDPAVALEQLNIVPFAISYEYESCDALKAREIYAKRRGPYTKAPGEDLKSIITGVKQPKGRIHIQVCPQITSEEIRTLAAGEGGNDMLRGVAALIDRRIYAAYRLFGTNYIAYDIKCGTSVYAGSEYTPAERAAFEAYLKERAGSVEGDMNELFDILLDIYANPVKNKIACLETVSA